MPLEFFTCLMSVGVFWINEEIKGHFCYFHICYVNWMILWFLERNQENELTPWKEEQIHCFLLIPISCPSQVLFINEWTVCLFTSLSDIKGKHTHLSLMTRFVWAGPEVPNLAVYGITILVLPLRTYELMFLKTFPVIWISSPLRQPVIPRVPCSHYLFWCKNCSSKFIIIVLNVE